MHRPGFPAAGDAWADTRGELCGPVPTVHAKIPSNVPSVTAATTCAGNQRGHSLPSRLATLASQPERSLRRFTRRLGGLSLRRRCCKRASADAGSDPAAITLRLPGGEQVRLGETLAIGADPGGRARLLALVRNQSGIVDNYELSVRGLPDDWWSIDPTTVYLVPFGTSGTYEQAVEVNLHPPRAPEAEARIWDLQIVAESKASGTQAAAARLTLGIQPYEAVKTKLEPERASGRRKARFDVAVTNTANAAVVVALDAEDPDGELDICFEPATLELPPGETLTSTMRVRPPRQKWIGRPEEKRISVHTRTGEEAQQAHAETAKPGALDEDGGPADGLIGRFGATPPNERPGQNGMRARATRAAEPRVPAANVNLAQLKVPRDGPPVPSAPLLPNQVVFRHKAWLPWWVATLSPFLMLVAVALYLLLPKGVVVPDVTGSKSAFAAEQKLTDADLKLAPTTRQKVSTQVPAGTDPWAGTEGRRDSGEIVRGDGPRRRRQSARGGAEDRRADFGKR